MQKIFTLLFLALALVSTSLAQQFEAGIGYTGSVPLGSMRNGWSSAHGVNGHMLYQFKEVPMLQVGVEMQYGVYATQNKPHQYQFANGMITNTTASLTSDIFTIGGMIRFSPMHQRRWSPFVDAGGGYLRMGSSIYIEDPTDPLACRALEQRTLVGSGRAYLMAGAGIMFNLSKLGDQNRLEFSVRTLTGGLIEYANMNRVYHDHSLTNPFREPTKDERPLNVTFINVVNNELHEHAVAELYTHPLRMMQFQLKYVFKLGGR